jgi:aminoglycoside 2'-N-acetyltransferase I
MTRQPSSVLLSATDALDRDVLAGISTLLHASFADWTEDDWQHTLGGVHAVRLLDRTVVAHGALVPRTLVVGDGPVRVGYVEGVAVSAAHRRRGLGGQVMDAVEAYGAAHYPLCALSSTTTAEQFYLRRGWRAWRGPTFVRTGTGRQRTHADDGSVYVRAGVEVDLTAELTCDWRAGDVW